MAIIIKTPEQIEKMRIAGRLAAEVLDMITPKVQAGITTDELNTLCHDYMVNVQKTIPATLNYGGDLFKPPFPKSICTSINHQVCHGIPGDRVLKNGDILNIDVTVIKDGYHGDTSRMFLIGKPSIQGALVTRVAKECLDIGIDLVRPGIRLGDIGHAIQKHAQKNRCSVVEDFCGHGIGLAFHEDPQVLHYGKPGTGPELKEGMIFTIEPMINAGDYRVKILKDGWTAVTKDHRLSAQWEHTILVTTTGQEVLTLSTLS